MITESAWGPTAQLSFGGSHKRESTCPRHLFILYPIYGPKALPRLFIGGRGLSLPADAHVSPFFIPGELSTKHSAAGLVLCKNEKQGLYHQTLESNYIWLWGPRGCVGRARFSTARLSFLLCRMGSRLVAPD